MTTDGNDPTMAEVLEEIRGLRRSTGEAIASLQRTLTTEVHLGQSSIRLAIAELGGAIARNDAKADLAAAQLRSELADVREIAQELLGLAHTHPGDEL